MEYRSTENSWESDSLIAAYTPSCISLHVSAISQGQLFTRKYGNSGVHKMVRTIEKAASPVASLRYGLSLDYPSRASVRLLRENGLRNNRDGVYLFVAIPASFPRSE